MPSTRIVPAVTSHRRGMSPTSVVLPDPDGPTRARVSPAAIVEVDRSRSTGRSGPYANDTPSSSIRPGDRARCGRASGASSTVGRVSMISNTRATAPGPLAELAVQARDRAEARPDRDAVQQEPGQRADPERRRR